MFLTPDQLIELTDAHQRETQMRELARLRIPFVEGRVRVKVLRSAVEARMGVKVSSPETEPQWEAWNDRQTKETA